MPDAKNIIWGEGDPNWIQNQTQTWPTHPNTFSQQPQFTVVPGYQPNPFDKITYDPPEFDREIDPSYVSKITSQKDAALIKADIDKLATLLEEMEEDVSEQNMSLMNDAIFFLREAVEMMDKFTDE